MSDAPRIVLCGATGRTGNAVAHALVQRDDVVLAAVVAPSVATTPSRSLPTDVPAHATLLDALSDPVIDSERLVIVDLTGADAAPAHMDLAIEQAIPFVLGATGISDDDIASYGAAFANVDTGLLVVPNFSIGAVLAMRVAAQLAARFPDVEIVETHHDGKRDSPSGTAVHTARLVAAARQRAGLAPGPGAASAGTGGGRGESVEGVPVHALRLPGATAHQEVVFGAPGELLTIRHDAIDRSCYAAGVAVAASHVLNLQGLETGLEHVL
jgi:4-hydroxy-tetrahydrodipicolinate reductase